MSPVLVLWGVILATPIASAWNSGSYMRGRDGPRFDDLRAAVVSFNVVFVIRYVLYSLSTTAKITHHYLVDVTVYFVASPKSASRCLIRRSDRSTNYPSIRRPTTQRHLPPLCLSSLRSSIVFFPIGDIHDGPCPSKRPSISNSQ